MINYCAKFVKGIFRHPLFSGGVIMLGGGMAVNAINYLYHLVMGRILGPTDYGVLASLFSILYMVGIVPTSTSVAIVKFIASNKNKKDTVVAYKSIRNFVMKISVIVSIIILISAPAISNFLHIQNTALVVLIAPILFFSLITLVNQAVSQGLMKFAGFVVPNLIASLAKILLGVLFVYLGYSVLGAMGAVLAGAILAYLVSIPYVKSLTHAKLSKKSNYDLKPFLKYALPVLIQALAFTSLFTTDLILVKHFFSSFEAGIYAALSTLGKIIFFASSPISSVMFPAISNRIAKNEKYIKIFWGSFLATVLVSLMVVLFYSVFPDFVIKILYGQAYLVASSELVWMGAFIFVYSLAYVLVNFALSLGRTKVVVFPAIAAIVQVVAIYMFHTSLRSVIHNSLFISIGMTLGISVYLVYNLRRKNEKQ